MEKALKLYATYKLSRDLAQRETEHRAAANPMANDPWSKNNLEDDVRSDVAEYKFFGDDDEIEYGQAKEVHTALYYDGRKVTACKRDSLSPEAKAKYNKKAALIRYLGSCWMHRTGRVPVSQYTLFVMIMLTELQCPLEHHDIAALERESRNSSTRCLAPLLPNSRRVKGSSNGGFIGINRCPEPIHII